MKPEYPEMNQEGWPCKTIDVVMQEQADRINEVWAVITRKNLSDLLWEKVLLFGG